MYYPILVICLCLSTFRNIFSSRKTISFSVSFDFLSASTFSKRMYYPILVIHLCLSTFRNIVSSRKTVSFSVGFDFLSALTLTDVVLAGDHSAPLCILSESLCILSDSHIFVYFPRVVNYFWWMEIRIFLFFL